MRALRRDAQSERDPGRGAVVADSAWSVAPKLATLQRVQTKDAGAKFELTREKCESGRVSYQVRCWLCEQEWQGSASVELMDGGIEWGAWEPQSEIPGWLVKAMHGLLRTQFRAKSGQGAASWPRRLTRWRDTPEAAT